MTEQLIEELELLEPFGKGNTRPLFAEKGLKALRPRIFGKNQNVLKCILEDKEGNRLDAVYFGDVQACLKKMQEKQTLSVTYYPTINEFRGERTKQITIVNYQ